MIRPNQTHWVATTNVAAGVLNCRAGAPAPVGSRLWPRNPTALQATSVKLRDLCRKAFCRKATNLPPLLNLPERTDPEPCKHQRNRRGQNHPVHPNLPSLIPMKLPEPRQSRDHPYRQENKARNLEPEHASHPPHMLAGDLGPVHGSAQGTIPASRIEGDSRQDAEFPTCRQLCHCYRF
jgi:hypothetical protein